MTQAIPKLVLSLFCLFILQACQSPQQVEKPKIEYDPNNAWDQLRAGFQLEHHADNPQVQKEIEEITKNKLYLNRFVKNAQPYLYYILQETKEQQLPTEIALLPMIESTYNPFAHSTAGASGLWQIMPETGKIYDVQQNWWFDGRRDIQNSTRAALSHLNKLKKRFNGNWNLTLAAYNSGHGTVLEAIKQHKLEDPKFWDLKLPRETRNYIPKLLAFAHIINHPKKYNVQLPDFDYKPHFVAIDTKTQMELYQAAEYANIPIQKIYQLNPGFNQWATDPNGPHRVNVPTHKAEIFKEQLYASSGNNRVTWLKHKVTTGDSLIKLAKLYRVSVDTLMRTNQLTKSLIKINQELLIPKNANMSPLTTNTTHPHQRPLQFQPTKTLKYTIKPNDTLSHIAKYFKVSVKELLAWNKLDVKKPLKLGKQLSIKQPTLKSAL